MNHKYSQANYWEREEDYILLQLIFIFVTNILNFTKCRCIDTLQCYSDRYSAETVCHMIKHNTTTIIILCVTYSFTHFRLCSNIIDANFILMWKFCLISSNRTRSCQRTNFIYMKDFLHCKAAIMLIDPIA